MLPSALQIGLTDRDTVRTPPIPFFWLGLIRALQIGFAFVVGLFGLGRAQGSMHWERWNLANTAEPSMCGGDAALLSNSFDHLLSLLLTTLL